MVLTGWHMGTCTDDIGLVTVGCNQQLLLFQPGGLHNTLVTQSQTITWVCTVSNSHTLANFSTPYNYYLSLAFADKITSSKITIYKEMHGTNPNRAYV